MVSVSVIEVAAASLDKGVVGAVTSRASLASSCGLALLWRGEEKGWKHRLEEALGEEEQGYSRGSQ